MSGIPTFSIAAALISRRLTRKQAWSSTWRSLLQATSFNLDQPCDNARVFVYHARIERRQEIRHSSTAHRRALRHWHQTEGRRADRTMRRLRISEPKQTDSE